MSAGASVEFDESLLFVNVMGVSVLRERGCVFFSEDAGHTGDRFTALADTLPFVEGVREGTQKEGRVCLAAYVRIQYNAL